MINMTEQIILNGTVSKLILCYIMFNRQYEFIRRNCVTGERSNKMLMNTIPTGQEQMGCGL